MTKCTHLAMTKQLTFLLTSLNIWIMFMFMAHLCRWSALQSGAEQGSVTGSILSGYQKCCQGLQSRTAVHISLCDIRLLRGDGKEAATVTVRDEGQTPAWCRISVTYQLYISVTQTTRFQLHFMYSRVILKSDLTPHHLSCSKCVCSNIF